MMELERGLDLQLVLRENHNFQFTIFNQISMPKFSKKSTKQKTIYQIDQSGKIEQTHRATAVAYSNTKIKTVYISSKEKQKLQSVFRLTGKNRIFVIQTFAILVYLLLESDITGQNKFVIDKEYPGHEAIIKSYIIQLFKNKKNQKIDPQKLHFSKIGKKSNAHKISNQAFNKKLKGRTVKAEEILALALLLEVKQK